MFGPPVGFGSGPGSGQAAASAGLPHAEVPGNLRERVAAVLVDEPEHDEPEVSWSHHDWDRRPFGLWRFLRPHRTRLILAVVLVALETVAVQMGPVLTQIGIDDGITAGDRGVLFAAAAAYMGLVALAAIMGMIRVSFTGRMGERLMEELRIRVFSHMQRQSIDFHTDEKAGVLMTRMTSDIEALSVLFHEGMINLAVQVLTLTVITTLLFSYDPLLAVITLIAAVPPTVGLSLWFRRRSARDYREVRDRIGELLSDLQESLAGIRVIAAHDRRDLNVEQHRQIVGRHRDANVSASNANSIYAPASEAIGIGTQAVLLAVGGVMTASGRITVGELAAYLLFLTSFFAPIQALVQLYNSYQQGGAAISKLRALLATSPTVQERPDAIELGPVRGAVSLVGVTFGYDPAHPVLRDISIEIEPGETVAFVGETGAGKSTIARLLTRFHDPDEGVVRIDGHDLRDVRLASLRSQLGVVLQEPFMFAGTIRDNVAFARPDAGDDELNEALASVGVGELVARLGGLDGPVHERGASLSAGERQLLALARAFVARPRILILDEATSNIDLESEIQVERAMEILVADRTAIVIAHRLATARRADRIVVVHDGRIVELGSHNQLVAQGGRYAAMFDTWVAHGGSAS